ncbi:MAG TPA: polymer-forming cytoskeletal protein [Longimicrobiales bacterium]
MWKKEDGIEPVATRPEPAPSFERAAPPSNSNDRATIGRSISIKGEVNGDEDLLIQGRVDGSVTLKQHAVTVGPEGEVKADIGARVITVEGSVDGNLTAQEQVILRTSARVQGNITAPRVVLEDGARFRGGVDMGETQAAAASPRTGVSGDRSTSVGAKPSTEHGSGSTERGLSAPGSKEAIPQAAAPSRQG